MLQLCWGSRAEGSSSLLRLLNFDFNNNTQVFIQSFQKLDLGGLKSHYLLQVGEMDDWNYLIEQDGFTLTVSRVSGKMLVDGIARCN